MATVSDQSPAAARLRAQQSAVTAALVRELRSIRRLLGRTPRGTPNRAWVLALAALTDRYGRASAELAARAYEEQRAASGALGRFQVVPDPPPGMDEVQAVAGWATAPLRLVEGRPQGTPEDAQQRAEAGAQKMTADTGRRTTLRAVRSDTEAVAWARAAALGACYFCKLLASRGAVYKDRRSLTGADSEFVGDVSEIKVHDHCHCQPIPIFRRDRFELSPQARDWDAIYREFAAGRADQLNAFRRALAGIEEGRIEWSPPQSLPRAA